MTLCRNPSPKEFGMIKAFVLKKYLAKVKLIKN